LEQDVQVAVYLSMTKPQSMKRNVENTDFLTNSSLLAEIS